MSVFSRYPVTGGNGVAIYSTFSAFPAGTMAGQLAVAADTGILYEWNGSAWQAIAGPGFGTYANQQLSNLSGTVAINQDLLPGSADTISLGSSTKSFLNSYIDSIFASPTGMSGKMLDTSANASLNWNTRKLVATDGSTTQLDWSSLGTLSIPATLNMNSNTINNVTDPTMAQQAATKNYVDTMLAALNPFEACYAATTGNLVGTYTAVSAGVGDFFTITATGAFTVDGTTPPVNSRILIKNQASGYQNGIYNLTVAGTVGVQPVLTRALDYDTPADVNNAGLIPIINGTTNAVTSWQQTANVTSIGPSGTALVFQEFTANPSLYLLKANNLSDVASMSASFNNISPMTTLGDIIYGGSSGAGTRLAGNTATTTQILTSIGTGSAAQAPAWNTLSGTTNRVTVSQAGSTITLSGPQDIATTSTPTFAAVISNSSNPATAGVLRLANADAIEWRNSTNSANIILQLDSSNIFHIMEAAPQINLGSATTTKLGIGMNAPQAQFHFGSSAGNSNTTSGSVGANAVILGLVNTSNNVGAGAFIVGGTQAGAMTASGVGSVSIGEGGCRAEGSFAIAMGNGAVSQGNSSLALGYGSLVTNTNSHGVAIGDSSSTTGQSANGLGYGVTAQAFGQGALGMFNIAAGTGGSNVSTDDVLIVGNGTSNVARSNAFSVSKDGKTKMWGTTSGFVALLPAASTTSYTLNLPSAQSSGGALVSVDSSGNVAFNQTPTLGVNASTTGQLLLASGAGSGQSVTIQNRSTTSAWNFNLPTSAGSAGQVLTSQAGGTSNMTWTTPTTGTVTSVALSDGSTTPIYAVSGSPVTTSGTLTLTLSTQTANTVFAGPGTAPAAQPTFRALVAADIPTISLTSGVSGVLPIANGGTDNGSLAVTAGGVIYADGTRLQNTGAGTTNQVLTSNGSSAPTFQTLPGMANSAVRSVTSTDNASTADNVLILSGASFTETLFTAVSNTGHQIQLIHNGTSVTDQYTLNTTSSQTIGGVASGSYVLQTKGEVLTIVSDGANWQILDHKTITAYSSDIAVTYTAAGTVTASTTFSRRVGDSLQVYAFFKAGTTTGSTFEINLPSGVAIDSNKLSSAGTTKVGEFVEIPSTGSYPTTGNGPFQVFYDGSTTGGVFVANASGSIGNFSKLTGTGCLGSSNNAATIQFTVPISGWQP